MASVRGAMILDDRMTSVLKSTTQALHMVVDSMSKMNTEMGKTPDMSQLSAAKQYLQNIDSEFASIERDIGQADGKQKQFNDSIKTGERNADSMAGKLKGAAAAAFSLATAARGISAFANFADDMARIEGRISIINDKRQTNAEIENMILQKSYQSGANYKDMADMITRIGTSASGAFENTAEIVDFAGELNKMFVIAGTSAQGIEGATLQITQAMSKGVLQGQEFNSVLEQAPGVINAIAKHLGVSTGELKQMASEGKITSQVLKDSLLEASAETAEAFNQIPWTLSGGIANRLKTAVVMAMKPAAEQLTAMVNSDQFHKAFEGLVQVIYALGKATLITVNIVSAGLKFMVDHWSQLKFIVLPLVAIIGVLMVVSFIKMAAAGVMAGASIFGAMIMANLPLVLIVGTIVMVILLLHEMGVTWEDAGRVAVGVGYAAMAMLKNLGVAIHNAGEKIKTTFHNAWEKVKEYAANAINFVIDKLNNAFAKLNGSKLARALGIPTDMLGHIEYTADIIKPDLKEYESIEGAYKKGHSIGFDKIGSKVGGLLDKVTQVKDNLSKGIGQSEYGQAALAGNASDVGGGGKTAGDRVRDSKIDKIANNTDKIKEALKISNEDLSYMRKWEEGRRTALYNVENKIKVETTIDRPDASFDIDGYAQSLGSSLLTQMDITKGGLSPV